MISTKNIIIITALCALSGCQSLNDHKEVLPLEIEDLPLKERESPARLIAPPPLIEIDLTSKNNNKIQTHWLNKALREIDVVKFQKKTFVASSDHSFSGILKSYNMPYDWINKIKKEDYYHLSSLHGTYKVNALYRNGEVSYISLVYLENIYAFVDISNEIPLYYSGENLNHIGGTYRINEKSQWSHLPEDHKLMIYEFLLDGDIKNNKDALDLLYQGNTQIIYTRYLSDGISLLTKLERLVSESDSNKLIYIPE